MEDVIVVENLWKRYKIGQSRKLTEFLPNLLSDTNQKSFWALKNINLRIKKGEKIGLIGPNGSGKSTLLKILAKISYPTKGDVKVTGKVATLLEVGAGFHPDLTGKENIFLSGSIMGMSLSEIKDKYRGIVEFSGVSKFLETPIKHYSSGMYMRLAFSVSVNLTWDILLLDEVLSVGDLDFQKKSLKKIKEFFNSDKTIIFVSHDLETMSEICERAILLKSGKVEMIDSFKRVKDFYNRYQV